MPVFEYKCKSCGSVSEILVGVTAEKPEVACIQCGCTDLIKLISTFSFAEGVAAGSARFPMASSCACGREAGSSCGCGADGACGCGGE